MLQTEVSSTNVVFESFSLSIYASYTVNFDIYFHYMERTFISYTKSPYRNPSATLSSTLTIIAVGNMSDMSTNSHHFILNVEISITI